MYNVLKFEHALEKEMGVCKKLRFLVDAEILVQTGVEPSPLLHPQLPTTDSETGSPLNHTSRDTAIESAFYYSD